MHPTWKFLIPIVAFLVQSGFGSVSVTQPEPFTAATSTATRQVKFVYARVGHPISFRWHSNQDEKIAYCRWDRVIPYDRSPLSIIASSPKSPITTNHQIDHQNNFPDGYFINSQGLHDGYCELTIVDVRDIDLTLWNSTVIDEAVRHDGLALGGINLTSLVKPSNPKLNELGDLIDVSGKGSNIMANISCCTYDGRPTPKLTIALSGQIIRETPGLDYLNNSLEVANQSCLEVTHVPLNWTHNEKKLTCFAEHPGYEEADLKRDTIVLNILHEPKIMSPLDEENAITFTMDKGEDKRVFVEFVSNPFAEIHWLIKTGSGPYENLPPNLEHDLVQNMQHGSWEAELTNPNELSESASFSLIITNLYGFKEVHVNVKIGSGARWGWIVIYIVGGLSILIICGFLILLLLKRQGWLCYDDEMVKRAGLYDSPGDIDERMRLPMRDDGYELNPTLVRTKEPVRTREGTVYVAPSTSM